jgi:hypothetical protein
MMDNSQKHAGKKPDRRNCAQKMFRKCKSENTKQNTVD